MFQLYDPLITPGEALAVGMKDLDEYSTKIGIFILESNGHVAHANSKAFSVAGITENTEDPDFARYIRDENGKLTGEIQEMNAMAPFLGIAPEVSVGEYKKAIHDLFNHSSTMGVTSFHDCGVGAINPDLDYEVLISVME